MGEEDAGAAARTRPSSPSRGPRAGARAHRPGVVAAEVARGARPLRRPGWSRPPLVDARPGGRHEGLPARRAVRGGPRARRGWRGRAGGHGLPQPAARRASRGVAGSAGCLFVAERGGGARQLRARRGPARRRARRGPPIARRDPIADVARRALRRVGRGRAFDQSASALDRATARDHRGAAAPGQPDEVRGRGPRRRLDLPALRRTAATARTSGTTPPARSS